jgi:hypothetical protein
VSLFSRISTDPARWTALWRVLEPYGGRLTADSIAYWSAHLPTLSKREYRRAARELAVAYRLLDTEEHARYLTGAPWRGPGMPFARARFERTVDAVIVAGPQAVARVMADPALISGYDDRAIPERDDPRWFDSTLGGRLRWALFGRDRLNSGGLPMRTLRAVGTLGFPALWYIVVMDQQPFDPEVPFVMAEPSRDQPRWAQPKRVAATLIEEALGGRTAKRPELFWVQVAIPSDDSAIFSRDNNLLDENGCEFDDDDGQMVIVVDIDPTLNGTSKELAATLTRRAAAQLLTCSVPWTDAQRDGLRELSTR